MRILNLFAGMGGNRALWKGHEVVAVEKDATIMDVYSRRFPKDTCIVGDVIEFINTEGVDGYDFIWASPPCQSHGQLRHHSWVLSGKLNPVVPEMTTLFGLIVYFQWYYRGKWVVENVVPYYQVLIAPTFLLQRHYFWSNFHVPFKSFPPDGIGKKDSLRDYVDCPELVGSCVKNKLQVLRNCVDPEIGKWILEHV